MHIIEQKGMEWLESYVEYPQDIQEKTGLTPEKLRAFIQKKKSEYGNWAGRCAAN